ncbi:MAG: hypothetical protein AB1767_03320 [Bacillota bacterium]
MEQDEQYLNLLAVFHYVVGGLLAAFACIPIIHLVIGIVIIGVGPIDGEAPPVIVGWLFTLVAAAVILAGWTLAVLVIIAGRKLQKRVSHTFCLVMAAIECVFTPFGTILGVFTIIMLMKESVKALFSAPINPVNSHCDPGH